MIQINKVKTMSVLLLSSLMISQSAFAKGGSVSKSASTAATQSANKSGPASHSANSRGSSAASRTTATRQASAPTQVASSRPANHNGSTVQKPTAGLNLHPTVAPIMSSANSASSVNHSSTSTTVTHSPTITSLPVRIRDAGGRGAAAAAAMMLQAENQKAQVEAQRAQSAAPANKVNVNEPDQRRGFRNPRLVINPKAPIQKPIGAVGANGQAGKPPQDPEAWVKEYQNLLAQYQKTPNEIGPNWTVEQAQQAMNNYLSQSFATLPKAMQDAVTVQVASEVTIGAMMAGDTATARAVATNGLAAAQRALKDNSNTLNQKDKDDVAEAAASFQSMLNGQADENNHIATLTGTPSSDKNGNPTLTYKLPGLSDSYIIAGADKPSTLVSKFDDGSITQRVLDSHGIKEVQNDLSNATTSKIDTSGQSTVHYSGSTGTEVRTNTSPSGQETSVTVTDSSGTSTYHESSNTITTAQPGSSWTYSVPSSGGTSSNNNSTGDGSGE